MVAFSLSHLLLTSHPPDSMEMDQLFQGIGQLFKAHSSGVKAGGGGVPQEAEWVGRDTECNLELTLCKGDKRGSGARMG